MPTGPLLLSNRLVLQRHILSTAGEPPLVVAAAGLGLAFSTPARPVQAERVLGLVAQDDRQQAPHFRDGQRDEVVGLSDFPCPLFF